MANKQVISLTENGDYIYFTGNHRTQEIEFLIGENSVFGTGELEVLSGMYENNIFTEIAKERDTEGVVKTIKFPANYSFNYVPELKGSTWYGIKLINASGTDIKVYVTWNSNTMKSNKPAV